MNSYSKLSNMLISKGRSLSEINKQNLIARLQDQNQELEDKNKRIAELDKEKNKKSKQKAK